MSECFTGILHEIKVQLTKTEDNALTIRYPQLPRVGDVVNLKREGKEVSLPGLSLANRVFVWFYRQRTGS